MLEIGPDEISKIVRNNFTEADLTDMSLAALLGHRARESDRYSVQRTRQIALLRFKRGSQINLVSLDLFLEQSGETLEVVITSGGIDLSLSPYHLPDDTLHQRRDGDLIDNFKYIPESIRKIREAHIRVNRHHRKRARKYYTEGNPFAER